MQQKGDPEGFTEAIRRFARDAMLRRTFSTKPADAHLRQQSASGLRLPALRQKRAGFVLPVAAITVCAVIVSKGASANDAEDDRPNMFYEAGRLLKRMGDDAAEVVGDAAGAIEAQIEERRREREFEAEVEERRDAVRRAWSEASLDEWEAKARVSEADGDQALATAIRREVSVSRKEALAAERQEAAKRRAQRREQERRARDSHEEAMPPTRRWLHRWSFVLGPLLVVVVGGTGLWLTLRKEDQKLAGRAGRQGGPPCDN